MAPRGGYDCHAPREGNAVAYPMWAKHNDKGFLWSHLTRWAGTGNEWVGTRDTKAKDNVFAFKEVIYHSATLKPYWE